MKYFYIAVEIEENGKRYAYALKVTTCDNLLSKLTIKGIVSATLCDAKWRATELCRVWNEAYKANGTYLFDSPTF